MSTVYTAFSGFSATKNPNGPWAFGYTATETSAFIPFNTTINNGTAWTTNGRITPAIYKNTGATFTIGAGYIPWPAGTLFGAPGYPNGAYSVTQFIAPSTGSYTVAVSAEGMQTVGDSANIHILVGGKSLYDANVTGSGVFVKKTVTIANVAKGTAIDFSIGENNNGASDNTIFSETITADPAGIVATAPAAQKATAGVSKSFTLGSFAETNATGPYTATVNWGDGTASSIIKLNAAGTIPATPHTFAGSGNKTVSVTVTDSASHSSNKVTFAVSVSAATGSISGTVFNDANGNGEKDLGEAGLGLWTVYIDSNKDGKNDAGDSSVTTNILGAWSFSGLTAGTYVIRVVPVNGLVGTTPTGGVETITLTVGQSSVGNLFGEKTTA